MGISQTWKTDVGCVGGGKDNNKLTPRDPLLKTRIRKAGW